MATYPLAIKRFVRRKNLIDTVYAEHMNDAQDEIEALQSVLGVNPHQDDRSLDSTWSWPTIKDRLEYMIRGKHQPAFHVYNTGSYTLSSDTFSMVTFAAPTADYDTHRAFSGNTYHIPRDGWYLFQAQVFFASTGLKGSRQLRLYRPDRGGVFADSNREYYGESRVQGDWLQALALTRATRGTPIAMATNIETAGYPNGKYTIKQPAFRGVLLRGV